MWVYSQINMREIDEKGCHIGPKWDGQVFEIKKGINEVSEEIGRAYFLFKLPFLNDARLSDEQKDDMLRQAAITAIRRHGKFAPSEVLHGSNIAEKALSAIQYLGQFKCMETREDLENLLKGEGSKTAAKA